MQYPVAMMDFAWMEGHAFFQISAIIQIDRVEINAKQVAKLYDLAKMEVEY